LTKSYQFITTHQYYKNGNNKKYLLTYNLESICILNS